MTPFKAHGLARLAHLGQLYGTEDYFEAHVEDVSRRVHDDPRSTDDHLTLAYLHDVLEDTGIGLVHLVAEGLTMTQWLALWSLTRYDCEPYTDYIARILANDMAVLVKYHDIRANLDANPPELLAARYQAALIKIEDRMAQRRFRQ